MTFSYLQSVRYRYLCCVNEILTDRHAELVSASQIE